MSSLPSTCLMPACCRVLPSTMASSQTKNGSPPPYTTRSPCKTPSLIVPMAPISVGKRCRGPQVRSAAKVVATLVRDAAGSGTSPRWCSSTDCADCIHTPCAFRVFPCLAMPARYRCRACRAARSCSSGSVVTGVRMRLRRLSHTAADAKYRGLLLIGASLVVCE